jgi:ribosome biogenesis GTPase
MFEFDNERLSRLRSIGLSAAILNRLLALPEQGDGATPARVTEVQRDAVTLHDGVREHRARPYPALLQALASDADALAVGDWVLAEVNTLGEWWVYARVAPEQQLARRTRSNGDGLQRRVIVSNVDTALLVMGLDDDFSLARLERYLAMVRVAGVAALVVLTKVDRCDDAAPRLLAVGARLRPAEDAIAVDARSPSIRAAFAPWLGEGQTLVLVGSSGAGKSTLTNTLLGAAVQDTGGVRDTDGRGRHTTTSRSLHRLHDGACIIDTPGLRTLRLDVDEEALAGAFDDIASLSRQCRFSSALRISTSSSARRGATR